MTPFMIALTLLGTMGSVYAQDDVDSTEMEEDIDGLKVRFNRLVREARRVIEDEGPQAGVDFYSDALLDPENQGYGQIHLRLANLYKKLDRATEAISLPRMPP